MTRLTKPVRRTTSVDAPHGIASTLVIALYPGGVIGIREARRRKEIHLSAIALYERALVEEASAAARQRRQTRRGRARSAA